MTEGKVRSKMMMTGGNGRRRPYALLLLLALGAAVLSVVMLQKMRERRVFAILLQEKDSQLLSLQLLLEKEKAVNKEMKRKFEELKTKSGTLRSQRIELNNKLMESESTATYLKVMQQELEQALIEKENHINNLQQKTSDNQNDRVAELTRLLQERDAELAETKQQLSNLNTSQKVEEKQETLLLGEKGTSSIDQEFNVTNGNVTTDNSEKETWVKFATNFEDESNQNSETSEGAPKKKIEEKELEEVREGTTTLEESKEFPGDDKDATTTTTTTTMH